MKQRLWKAWLRHPFLGSGLTAALAIACLAAGVQAVGWLRWELFALRIDLASARSDATSPAGRASDASWSFAFRDRAVRLAVPVSAEDLDAARAVDTSAMFRARGALRAHYVSRAVVALSRSAFIDSLAAELRAVRRERGLDDDEYLELIARSAQSLRYGTVGARVRLPVEVVASGFGVCSEKSLLLAALMLHEGYETGMWIFDSQNHVAVAVASDGARFRGRYAFIEPNRVAYIGEYDIVYRAGGPVFRAPQFVALGGRKTYGSGKQVEYILGQLESAKKRARLAGPYVQVRVGSPASVVQRRAEVVGESDSARALVSYIRGQADDRKSVFARLALMAAQPPAVSPALVD